MAELELRNIPDKKERAAIGKKARSIYEPLRTQLEETHWGQYIAINVENGDYAIAEDDITAARSIRAKYPGVLPFTIRIGYKAVIHFGGTGVRDGKKS